jgi:hypothetical protein
MRWLVKLLQALFGSKPKPKPPEPPKPPVREPKFLDLLLRQEAGKLTQNGQPFLLFGAIPCWDGEEKDHNGWPGFDQAWIDYCKPFGVNALHLRLGPCKKDDRWPNGLNYQFGPYVNDDPAQGFEPRWWDRVRGMVEAAGNAGMLVEVDLIDGWVVKHAGPGWGDFECPWPAEDVAAATNHMTPIQREFLRKAVEEIGPYGNVILQDSNECGVSGRYRPEWTFEMVDLVRRYEQEVGLGVVHMFGTCSGRDEVEADPRIDYSSTHRETGIDGPHHGKFRQNNEHNSEPLFTPEQEHALYCAARQVGQAWWFWRGGRSREQMDETLKLWASGCEGMGGGSSPFDVPTVSWIKVKPHGVDYYDATPLINDAAYCHSIGFPRGQSTCPCRPEGDPFREATELKSMGGRIQWSLEEATGTIAIKPRGNGFGFSVSGHGSALVVARVPARGQDNLARDGQGKELRITR